MNCSPVTEEGKTIPKRRFRGVADAKAYANDAKPFTKALLLRMIEEYVAAEREWEEVWGASKVAIAEGRTAEEFAGSCAASLASELAERSMKQLGLPPWTAPYDPPSHAPSVVAFSMCIVIVICSELAAEGVGLDFAEEEAKTARLFFLLYPDKEILKHVRKAEEVFLSVIGDGRDIMRKWGDTLYGLVHAHVHQWTIEDEDIRNYDYLPRFRDMLNALLYLVKTREE